MPANPALGVFLHSVGGFAAGSFYIPYRKVRNWSWESYWLAGGVFSWIIAPWVFAGIVARLSGVELLGILREGLANHRAAAAYAYLFGVMWGIGGLTFGLSMRYLGLSLGMAVSLGFCAVFGTIIPPVYATFHHGSGPALQTLVATPSGRVTLGGLALCVAGIALCGRAGIRKERELPEDVKRASIAEFSFAKGMWVAAFAGIMSACMNFGIEAGGALAGVAAARGVPAVVSNTPVLIVVLAGGFTTNCIWCLLLNARNRSFGDYVGAQGASLAANYVFSALAGVIWYLQFFFYGMGSTQLGDYRFSSWTLHMATIILFSNMWGLILKEWRGASRRVHHLIFTGLVVLILSTLVVGYGNMLKQSESPPAATQTAGP